MFGERFAFGFEGSGDESWTPPWLRSEGRPDRGPRFFAMHRGRGPFGHGPFSPGGSFGPGGEGSRFFGRGDMKFALLQLLQERPMHGYEMMKALEEKSGGFYTPSPGSIYPTLQMLEDRGFVTSSEVEGKRVYSITDSGRSMLAERRSDEEGFAGPPWMRGRGPGGHGQRPEMRALRSEAAEVGRLFAIAGRMSLQNPEKLARLRTIIERTRKELSDLIYNTDSQHGQ
ncbi:MAG TPA: PadR family transcriptional regulator [Ktedonobacteraceae bacterium]|nr:PadR family transcriptional regulator [Ktedonobacteraceae bacterium]